jgi:hypothetical protein
MEPVKLTSEQIQNIVAALPQPPGIGTTARQIAHRHQRERLREALSEIKLVPVQAAFDELKETILNSYKNAFVSVGLSVGLRAGVALGGPLTQLSLNTFHFVGAQSGVAQAFQVVRDYLTGSKTKRSPSMKIYFKRPGTGTDLHDVIHEGTFDSVLAKRHEFEQTTVANLVTRHEILTLEEARLANVPEMMELHKLIRPRQFENFATRFTYVLKLNLNTYRMYSHKITMQKLAQAIEGPQPPDLINCIWRSQRNGIMYVLVDESKDLGKEIIAQPHAVLIFLQQLIHKFDLFIAGGIANIQSIEPTEIQVIEGIHRISHHPTKADEHFVFTNHRKTRWQGISLADLEQLFTQARFEVLGRNTEKLYLKIKYDGEVPLIDELKNRVKAASGKPLPKQTEADKALVKASRYHYANTIGSNYKKIVWRSDIDLFRSMDNDAHTILDDLGIDAARIFVIFKFRQTLQRFSASINVRHIALIFDLLTNLGIINSLTFTGLNRRKIGTLALASTERAIDAIVNTAFYGGKETASGVSSSIYIGKTMDQIGTGAVRVETDHSVVPERAVINPSVDELSSFEGIDLGALEPTLEDLLQGLMPELELSHEPIDHQAILQASHIAEELPVSEPPSTTLKPSGARLTTASKTVQVLENLVTGSAIIEQPEIPQARNLAETTVALPEIPDITDLVITDDLELLEPVRAVPARQPGLSDLQKRVKVMTNPSARPKGVSKSGRHDPTRPPSTRTPSTRGRPPSLQSRPSTRTPARTTTQRPEIIVPSITDIDESELFPEEGTLLPST